MALLDQFLGLGSGIGTAEFPAVAVSEDPDVVALREAQARRFKRTSDRQGPQPLADQTRIPGIDMMGSVGLLGGSSAGRTWGMPMAEAAAPAPTDAPTTNDPTSGEPQVFKGNVPIPRPRPAGLGADADALPPNATPTVGDAAPLSMAPAAAQPQPPQPGPGQGGFSLGNLLRPENAPLLLSLAGGFAGAPSFGTGMRRAFTGATPAAMQLAQNAKTERSQAATYQALLAKGVPPREAMAAILDPNIMKATAAKYFETKPLTHYMNEDMFGNKIPGSFDPNTGKHYDAAGNPVATAGAAAPGTSTTVAGMPTQINNDLVGEDYLGQFPKEVQSAVRNYVRGDSMPTGNPRKGFTQAVKMIAQKYGEDTGVAVSDQKYIERRQYRNQLASGNSGVGAQRNALRQGLEHLEGVTNSAEALGNWDLGLTPLTKSVNWARGLTTSQQAKVNDMRNKVQQLAGEMGKFFSGSAGGGVHERESTRQRFEAVSSPQELAAAIDSSLELLEGGLHAREQQRDEILGANSGVEILSAKDKERVDRIRQLSRRLKGEAPAGAPAAAPPAGKTKTNVNWSIVN